jgi:hypothetical protein
MPWCDDCAKFWNPASMPEDGTCPTCHRVLVDARERRAHTPNAAQGAVARDSVAEHPYDIDVKALAGEAGKAPWHFKLLVVAIVAYLLWRVVQLVGWFIN